MDNPDGTNFEKIASANGGLSGTIRP